MLRQLSVRNLALIAELELEFGGGLNILTGETGAGKSVLIGALSLVLGERAERDKIRRGSDRCEIAALFQPPVERLERLAALLDEAGLPPCEDGDLLMRRVVTKSGSRCFVNGSAATAQTLRQLGDELVEVHGPYEHQALLRSSRQLELLDAYAGLSKQRAACLAAWQQWQAALAELADARKEAPSPERRDVLQFQVDEIRRAKLDPAEEEDLKRRHAVAANAGELLDLANSAAETLSGDDGAADLVGQVVRIAQQLARIDPALGEPLLERLDLVHEELVELSRELAGVGDDVDADPASLREMEERIALLQRLKRKYGGTLAAAIAHGEEATAALHRMEHFDEWLAEREAAVTAAEDAFRKAAHKIRRGRRKAAAGLAEAIADRLQHLGFADATFAVELTEAKATATGLDHAEMHFAPNPGEGLRPLRQIASSGEIARVMLAIKAVLARNDRTPLLVFDEVDANVGGEVANRVGAQMRTIAADRQVLCISHLPQVAAAAHHHFRVAKEVTNDRTFARIALLDDDDRVEELTRMLGGRETSTVVGHHARELIASQTGAAHP